MRAVAILLLLTTTAAAQPANPPAKPVFEGRGFIDAQLGLGVSAADDLDFATAWSVGAGLRVLPHAYVFARLRHTSPFYKSLLYDLGMKLFFEAETDEPGVDTTRTHETDLSLGLRLRYRRMYVEAAASGALVYRIGDQSFDTQTHGMLDASVGFQLTPPSSDRDDHFDGMLFFQTSVTRDGEFMKAIVGLSLNVEVF